MLPPFAEVILDMYSSIFLSQEESKAGGRGTHPSATSHSAVVPLSAL